MTTTSEIVGHFGGFVFTDAGKRRMLLRQDGHNRLLKVPRILRRRIIGKFRPGELLRLAVAEEQDPDTGVIKPVVLQVLPGTADIAASSVLPTGFPTPDASCVVRVCSKKNCWRNGGRELWEALRQELTASGGADRVELRQVGCLDRCKQAPNADVGNRVYTRCTSRDASAIIAHAVGNPSPCEIAGR